MASIAIPDSVERIGYGAFNGCTSLLAISFGTGLKSIGADAFRPHQFYEADERTSIYTAGNLRGCMFVGKYPELMVKQSDMDGNICWYIIGDTLTLSRGDS